MIWYCCSVMSLFFQNMYRIFIFFNFFTFSFFSLILRIVVFLFSIVVKSNFLISISLIMIAWVWTIAFAFLSKIVVHALLSLSFSISFAFIACIAKSSLKSFLIARICLICMFFSFMQTLMFLTMRSVSYLLNCCFLSTSLRRTMIFVFLLIVIRSVDDATTTIVQLREFVVLVKKRENLNEMINSVMSRRITTLFFFHLVLIFVNLIDHEINCFDELFVDCWKLCIFEISQICLKSFLNYFRWRFLFVFHAFNTFSNVHKKQSVLLVDVLTLLIQLRSYRFVRCHALIWY